jgi:hypothetical protein
MANQGIMHLAAKPGGKPYCNSRRAIMSTTLDRIETDAWKRVCVKCNATRLRWEAKEAKK